MKKNPVLVRPCYELHCMVQDFMIESGQNCQKYYNCIFATYTNYSCDISHLCISIFSPFRSNRDVQVYIIFFFNQYFYQVYIKLTGVTKYCDLLTSYDLISDFQVNEPISSCRVKCIYCFGGLLFALFHLSGKIQMIQFPLPLMTLTQEVWVSLAANRK